jgi:hypothetical protein
MKMRFAVGRALALAAIAAFALVALGGCDLFGTEKDPIEGTWDWVVYCEDGARFTLAELGAPEGYAQILEFSDLSFIYTMTDPEADPMTESISGTWSLDGETYILVATEYPDEPMEAWLVGDELRFSQVKNDLYYWAFDKR